MIKRRQTNLKLGRSGEITFKVQKSMEPNKDDVSQHFNSKKFSVLIWSIALTLSVTYGYIMLKGFLSL
jgi:hypothetical protein